MRGFIYSVVAVVIAVRSGKFIVARVYAAAALDDGSYVKYLAQLFQFFQAEGNFSMFSFAVFI